MSYSNSNSSVSSVISNNTKLQGLESTLQQSMVFFKDMVLDFEQLYIESANYKSQLQLQKEMCERKTCRSSNELKKDLETKNNILQALALKLTSLYETKDFTLINEAFQIICGDLNVPQCVLKTSPKSQELDGITSTGDLNDETLNEIEGTPTGRTSPIIQSKKTRISAAAKSSDFRDKKKCPNTWPMPEKKNIKLTFTNKCTTPTRAKPGGKMKQARLNLVKVKQTNIVDLTCSPEFAGGLRTVKSENDVGQTPIKRELIDNDDTILPSPTSAPDNYTLFKSIAKASPIKFKKPLSLKCKSEKCRSQLEDIENKPLNNVKNEVNTMEESINILQHLHTRYPVSPVKETKMEPLGDDTTYCETDNSISLLQNVNNLNALQDNNCSPQKRPLAENKNIVNTPPKVDAESSNLRTSARDTARRCIPELVEPLYKEPTVRKKVEKRALPGWCCDDCKRFYGALYSDDPVMMARKIEECSKHRGRHNPARPKTPPNFWNPRWNVPEDTEELNRMNDAL